MTIPALQNSDNAEKIPKEECHLACSCGNSRGVGGIKAPINKPNYYAYRLKNTQSCFLD